MNCFLSCLTFKTAFKSQIEVKFLLLKLSVFLNFEFFVTKCSLLIKNYTVRKVTHHA